MVRKGAVLRDIRVEMLAPMAASARWNIVKIAFMDGLGGFPLKSESAFPNILAEIQSGRMQCWAGFADGEKGPILCGMLFTSIANDPRTCSKRLSILAARAYKALHSDAYKKVLGAIEDFAKENGCDTIEVMAAHPRVQKMLERAGYPSPLAYYIKEL